MVEEFKNKIRQMSGRLDGIETKIDRFNNDMRKSFEKFEKESNIKRISINDELFGINKKRLTTLVELMEKKVIKYSTAVIVHTPKQEIHLRRKNNAIAAR